MHVRIATLPGRADRPNEDHAAACGGTAVVVDGVTARTETHCVHGVAWFAEHLARGVLDARHRAPRDALRAAIVATAARHAATCDLAAPATPCAAVGIVQVGDGRLRYLVLGDVTVVLGGKSGERVVCDGRVEDTARAQRDAAARLPLGSPARDAALREMKLVEIAARNRAGGYWIAGADPAAADEALVGEVALPDVTRVALLSDGAARAVDPFGLTDWRGVLHLLAHDGPRELLDRVRAAERADPDATRRPRTKVSDDATAVFWDDLAGAGDDLRERECASR
ncbi:MAG TPA: hypothetical protein VD903_18395 [Pseudonocardia sp.]|nr:hypothetical protein [Pseudonocardia sp.]